MTCIIGIETEDGVYIGGDHAAISDTAIASTISPKIFFKGDFLYGYAGSFREGQVLQYILEEPNNNRSDIMEYLIKDYVPAVRSCFEKEGILLTESDSSEESIYGFLIGYKGMLLDVGPDLQVNRYKQGYTSIGCGDEYALGSLYTTKNRKNAKRRIEIALKAAAAHSTGVCEPFDVEFLKNEVSTNALQIVK